MLNLLSNIKFTNLERVFIIFMFVFLWLYLIIRAFMVFYVHDEIVTKWIYMISWNPLPYQGYIDANNHFLNSLLGGFFIRLFRSDALWIVRLPNLLAFPFFFWSAFGFRSLFDKKVNYWWFLISLTCTAFIIEFFALARGYGISIAMMIFAILRTIIYCKDLKISDLYLALIAWLLALYANLTLIPFAITGIVYLAVFTFKNRRYTGIIAIFLTFFPIGYLVKYSFHLQSIGKLYLGKKEGFFASTVHSLTQILWNTENIYLDLILGLLTIFILFTMYRSISKSGNIVELKLIFSVMYVLGIFNILLQHWFFGVVFPVDRGALYLVVFFSGAICFSVDYWKNEWIGIPFIILTLFFFALNFNVNKSCVYDEHFDKELLTKIPPEIKGIPPGTGGRYWSIDNELTRVERLPLRAYQEISLPLDTIEDYIITKEKLHPELLKWYHPVYKDKISDVTLFERNSFLSRKLTDCNFQKNIEGTDEFYDVVNSELSRPLFLRCSGAFKEMNIFKEALMVFSAEDSLTHTSNYYRSIPLTESCAINDSNEIRFDFTFSVNCCEGCNQIKVYIWNKKRVNLKGNIKVEVYEII